MHFSTDYVFDGSGDQPRAEDAPTAPMSAYGRSKLAGERAVAESGCKHLIFRTSWVYDAMGNNFVNTMLRVGATREELRVVNDQMGTPTYAPHLAGASVQCLDKALEMDAFPSGVYHMAGGGEPVSWHGFAEAIFKIARAKGMELTVKDVHAIATSEYPLPAPRPLNSRLDMKKLHDVFGLTMLNWHNGLRAYFNQKLEAN
jgi:dTDP-4-dehydrorhamnose reductase